MWRYFFMTAMALALWGCASIPPQSSPDYYRVKEPIQCVPYARGISGIEIYGDAHTWWNTARSNYSQGRYPQEGAVMVLSQTKKMRYGHVAVVKRIVNDRLIEVAHSNWGYDRNTRRYVYNKMRVKDISPNNDWTMVRFWDYPSGTFGRAYPVSGFIYKN